MNWQLLLTSSVISAVIAGIVSLLTTERNIQMENVTQERAKWRDMIKQKAVEVRQAALENDANRLGQLRLVFALNLNPFDEEDNAILSVISQLEEPDKAEQRLTEFSERVSLLLKHDWERAKYEASFWFSKIPDDPSDLLQPKRMTYDKFKEREADWKLERKKAMRAAANWDR